MLIKVHHWTKRLLLGAAALPLCQAVGGCDSIVNAFAGQLASSTFSQLVASIQQTLLLNFPSADILQILLGANRQPFFQG
jgi:hypothetical protein